MQETERVMRVPVLHLLQRMRRTAPRAGFAAGACATHFVRNLIARVERQTIPTLRVQ